MMYDNLALNQVANDCTIPLDGSRCFSALGNTRIRYILENKVGGFNLDHIWL